MSNVILKTMFVIGLSTAAFSPALATTRSSYVIQTFKNGVQIGSRVISVAQLRAGAKELIQTFEKSSPSYAVLVDVAREMNAKDRCVNLYIVRTAAAGVEVGIYDASAKAEEFLGKSIRSLEQVNEQTNVTCAMV